MPGNYALAFAPETEAGFGISNSPGMFASTLGTEQSDNAAIEVDVGLHVHLHEPVSSEHT